MSLNAKAAQFAVRCGARSATDITGVGLLGHGMQLARASNVTLELGIDTLPVLEGAPTFAEQGLLSAATYANRDYVGDFVRFDADVGLTWQDLLFDPQTSGGLLMCCPPSRAAELLRCATDELSTDHAVIGRVVEAVDGPCRARFVFG